MGHGPRFIDEQKSMHETPRNTKMTMEDVFPILKNDEKSLIFHCHISFRGTVGICASHVPGTRRRVSP